MAAITPLASPIAQASNPLQQGAFNPRADSADTTVVKPINATERGGAGRTGAGESSYSDSRRPTEGVNQVQNSDRGDAQTGLLSRARNTTTDGNAERPDLGRSEASSRSRARASGQSFEANTAVVESVVKAELSQKAAEAPPRFESTPRAEARIKTEQFKATLSDVRNAEPRVANDNERPVSLDTNDSSEPVGRYDKSA